KPASGITQGIPFMNLVPRNTRLSRLTTVSSLTFVAALMLTTTVHAEEAAAPETSTTAATSTQTSLETAEESYVPEVAAEPEPWSLTGATGLDQFLDPLGIKVYGWIEQSYTYNGRSPHDRMNNGRVFDDRSNDYRLNQVALNFERELS